MSDTVRVEYLWIDGAKPMQQIRSKTRVLEWESDTLPKPSDLPDWNYDGSSCYQAAGDNSDLVIKPQTVIKDPVRGGKNFITLCEVFRENGRPHETNTRSKLRAVQDSGGHHAEAWVGFEQEYTLFAGRNPLGWPENGYPKPQGPFYCGVGADTVFGRDLVEKHLDACIEAELAIYGVNAEVMPGQWEFQIGYRGFKNETLDVVTLCDHLVLARYLLSRLGEHFDITVSYDNKPVKGNWNGAGCHTNFSTIQTRDPETGWAAIDDAIAKLAKMHNEHIAVYGDGLQERLTGDHETCAINEFRSGVSDRGASIRIPVQVKEKGYGYIEDRRPGANCDPYLVASRLITTVCGLGPMAKPKPKSKTTA